MLKPDRLPAPPRTSPARVIALVGLAGGAFLWAACGADPDDAPMDPSMADVKSEAQEAVETAQDYLTSEQRELARRAELALEGTKEDVMDAKRELAKLPEEARAELEHAIERADEAGEELGREISDLQKAGADGLAEVEDRLEAALEEAAEARREITDALSRDQKQASN